MKRPAAYLLYSIYLTLGVIACVILDVAFNDATANQDALLKLDVNSIEQRLSGSLERLTPPNACHVELIETPLGSFCGNFPRHACASGEYHDGTGVGRSWDVIQAKIKEISDALESEISKDALTALKSDEKLKRLVAEATGASASSPCEGECLERLTETLTVIVHARALAPPALSGSQKITRFQFGKLEELRNHPAFQNLLLKFKTKAREALIDEEMVEKLKEKFPQVKELIIEKLKTILPQNKAREKAFAHLRTLRFGGASCGSADSLHPLVREGAGAVQSENEIHLCLSHLFSDTSHFVSVSQLAHALAHAVAHAVDLCALSGSLLSCLNEEENHLNPDTSCEGGNGPTAEAFAQWLTAEIISDSFAGASLTQKQFQTGYANILRNKNDCPSAQANILLANPNARTQVGCERPARTRYCPGALGP